jgi:hypothetical protein
MTLKGIMRVLGPVCCAGILAAAAFGQTRPTYGDDKSKEKPPQYSDAEREILLKLKNAPDTQSGLKLVSEFLTKNPKTKVKAHLANDVAVKIAETQDLNQKIGFCESYLQIFKSPPRLT